MSAPVHIIMATPFPRYDNLESRLRAHGLEVTRIRSRDQLVPGLLTPLSPRYIFFPHWSWKIPADIFETFESVVFHMTDLPFGRGGSPLQNLIVRGYSETMLTALRCVAELDAGPIYLKRSLTLAGSAEQIFARAADVMYDMIIEIVSKQIRPTPQVGKPTLFRRRQAEEGDIAGLGELAQVYDWIRMLDADGYPPAFLETEHLRLRFSRASLGHNEVRADVRITRK